MDIVYNMLEAVRIGVWGGYIAYPSQALHPTAKRTQCVPSSPSRSLRRSKALRRGGAA